MTKIKKLKEDHHEKKDDRKTTTSKAINTLGNTMQKSENTDDEPFLEPIIFIDTLKKHILKLINKVADEKISEETKVYLWSKLSDPSIHPNDYLKFEEPSEFTFDFILTTCRGLYKLNNLTAPLHMNGSLQETSQSLVEEALMSRSESTQNDLDDFAEENHLPVIPNDADVFDEIITSESEENLSTMKIKEVFNLFKSSCCKKRRDGICDKRHYLIGLGEIVLDEKKKSYYGLHIYLYPDFDFNQVDVPEKNIKDALYRKFQTEKETPGIQNARPKYIAGYIKEFSALLEQF